MGLRHQERRRNLCHLRRLSRGSILECGIPPRRGGRRLVITVDGVDRDDKPPSMPFSYPESSSSPSTDAPRVLAEPAPHQQQRHVSASCLGAPFSHRSRGSTTCYLPSTPLVFAAAAGDSSAAAPAKASSHIAVAEDDDVLQTPLSRRFCP